MSHDEQIKNKLYRNWVKAALGLKYLKNGLESFVDEEVRSQQATFLNDIGINAGLSQVTCGLCTNENVLICPTKGMCYKSRGNCSFHTPGKNPRQCPNKICNKLVDKIVTLHRYGMPSWKNTCATKWCTDHWEIAKCFIAETGYKDKNSAAETDCAGLLSICHNALFMQNVLATPISQPGDLVLKNKQARNTIIHSSNLEVTDADLTLYIDDMIRLLNDNAKLISHPDAVTARMKLNELKTDQFVITLRDKIEVRKESLRAIEEKKEEALQELDVKILDSLETVNERKKQLTTSADEREKHMQDLSDKLCNDLQTRYDNVEESIENKLDTKLKETLNALNKAVHDCQTKLSNLQEQITDVLKDLQICQSDIRSLQTELGALKENHRNEICKLERRQKLLDRLREMYTRHLSTIPVSPLLRGIHSNISSMYTDLVIRDDLIHQPNDDTVDSGDDQDILYSRLRGTFSIHRNCVRSYKDIFFKGTKCCKNIFLIGDAGMGKTTWSLKLVDTWLSGLKKKEQNLDIDNDNERLMLTYEYVFYILLRNARSDGNIIDMIKNQLFRNDEDFNAIAGEVLETEKDKCLILLDGLDEWSLPSDLAGTLDDTGLPLRNNIEGCTIITTTRPWKLEILRLRQNEIDRAVEIKGLDTNGVIKLANRSIAILNSTYGKAKVAENFLSLVKGKYKHILKVPLMLISQVCLWHRSGQIDDRMAYLYSSLLDILIKYAEDDKQGQAISKLSNIHDLSETKKQWRDTNCHLPECLSEKIKCKLFGPLLLKVGHLAFHGLFSPDNESSLVFTRDSLEEFVSEKDFNIALEIGILSKTQTVANILDDEFSVSFLHKTMQEFLAAVYMISGDKQHRQKYLTVYTDYCKTHEDVFETENILLLVSEMCPEMVWDMTKHISEQIEEVRYENNIDFLHNSWFSCQIFTFSQIKLYRLLLSCEKNVRQTGHYSYIKHHILTNIGNRNETCNYINKYNDRIRMSLVVDTRDCLFYMEHIDSEQGTIINQSDRDISKHNDIQSIYRQMYLKKLRITHSEGLQEHNLFRNEILKTELHENINAELTLDGNPTNMDIDARNHSEGDTSYITMTDKQNVHMREFYIRTHKNKREIRDPVLQIDLTQDIQLETLYLKHIETERVMLPHYGKLRHIFLIEIKHPSNENDQITVEHLNEQVHLITLVLSNITGVEGQVDLTQNIHLETLKLENIRKERVLLPQNGKLQDIYFSGIKHPSDEKGQITVEHLNEQVHLRKLVISVITGVIGQVDLTQNKHLDTLKLENIAIQRVMLPQNGNLQDIYFSGIKHPSDEKGQITVEHLNEQVHLRKLVISVITGVIGQVDLTQNKHLDTLKLENIAIQRVMLPQNGNLQDIYFSGIKHPSDENGQITVKHLNKQVHLIKLVISGITGVIGQVDLTQNKQLDTLKLENIAIERVMLPQNGKLQDIYFSGIKHSSDENGQITVEHLNEQVHLRKLVISDITGVIGQVELTKNIHLDTLELKNIAIERVMLPQYDMLPKYGKRQDIYFSGIKHPSDQNGQITVEHLNEQMHLINLVISGITGVIRQVDLTQNIFMDTLDMENIAIERIMLPQKGILRYIWFYDIKHPSDQNGQITVEHLNEQVHLIELVISDITGVIGQVDLTQNRRLQTLKLKYIRIERVMLPQKGNLQDICLKGIKHPSDENGQITVEHFYKQENLMKLVISGITGVIGQVDLTQNRHLRTLKLEYIRIERVMLPQNGKLQDIYFSGIKHPSDENGQITVEHLNEQVHLIELVISDITGVIGQVDLTKNVHLETLNLVNIAIERVMLPQNGNLQDIYLKGIKHPSDENGQITVEHLNEQVHLIKLVISDITGVIGQVDLTKNVHLETLNLVNIAIERVMLPQNGNLQDIYLKGIKHPSDENGQITVEHLNEQVHLIKLVISGITGVIGHVDLTQNIHLDTLKLENIAIERVMLPQNGNLQYIYFIGINHPSDENGQITVEHLNEQVHLIKLVISGITGVKGQVDLTQNIHLGTLALVNIAIERVLLPQNGNLQDIYFSGIKHPSDQNGQITVEHLNKQVHLIKLVIIGITGVKGQVDLTQNIHLDTLKLENIAVERVMLPQNGNLQYIYFIGINHPSDENGQITVEHLNEQVHLIKLVISGITGVIRQVDLTKNLHLETLALVNIAIERVLLPQNGNLQDIYVSGIKHPSDQNGQITVEHLNKQVHLIKLVIIGIIGVIGQVDLTQNIHLDTLKLENIAIERVMLPQNGNLQDIYFSGIKHLSDQNGQITVEHLNEQVHLIKLVISDITGVIGQVDLTQNIHLKTLKLEYIRLERVMLPQNGNLQDLYFSGIKHPSDQKGQITVKHLNEQVHLIKLVISGITNVIRQVDLTKNIHLETLALVNIAIARVMLPQNGKLQDIYFSGIKHPSYQNGQITVEHLNEQVHLIKLAISDITGVIGQVDLTQNIHLDTLELEYIRLERVMLPQNGKLQDIYFSGIKHPSDQNGQITVEHLNEQVHLIKLAISDITGVIGQADLTQNIHLDTLELINIRIERVMLPQNGNLQDIYFSGIKHPSDQNGQINVKHLNEQVHLIELVISSITGVIGQVDLTQNIHLKTLKLEYIKIERVMLPQNGNLQDLYFSGIKHPSDQNGQITVKHLNEQVHLIELVISSITGVIGQVDLTQNIHLKTLKLEYIKIERVMLPQNGNLQDLYFSGIKHPSDQNGQITVKHLNEQVHLIELVISSITGVIGQVDLTQNIHLKTLKLEYIKIERVMLPQNGNLQDLYFSGIKHPSDQNGQITVKHLNEQVHLIKLVISGITGVIGQVDLTQNRHLRTLKFEYIRIERVMLPQNGSLQDLYLSGINHPSDQNGQITVEHLNEQVHLIKLVISDITGVIGQVDLTQNIHLETLKLEYIRKERVMLPQNGNLQDLYFSDIKHPSDQNGQITVEHLNEQVHLIKLVISGITGVIGQVDLTHNVHLRTLKLEHIRIERVMLPQKGNLQDIYFSGIKHPSDQNGQITVEHLNEQVHLIKLVISDITGVIGQVDLTHNVHLKTLKLENKAIQRVMLPQNGKLQEI